MLHTILVTYLLPLLIYGAITGTANLLLSRKSQVELWAESNPKLAGAMKLLRAVGLDPWQIISAISLWATKKLPDAQRSEGLKADDPKMPKPPNPPTFGGMMGGALALRFVLSVPLTGCAWFDSKLPKAEACLPTPAALAGQVAVILADGGDYVAKLEALALKETEDAVKCAVQEFLSAKKPGVGAGDPAARERALNYLELKGVK